MALVNYGIQYLVKKKYHPIQPPFFVKQSVMEATCQIGEFEENLYRIVTSKSDKTEKTEETMVEEKKKADPTKVRRFVPNCYLRTTYFSFIYGRNFRASRITKKIRWLFNLFQKGGWCSW